VSQQTLTVPDIGGAEDAEVIEVCVAVGDRVEVEQSLIVLESDKASMEVPAEHAGTVIEVLVKEGDGLAEGSPIVVIETDAVEATALPVSPPPVEPALAATKPEITEPAPAKASESVAIQASEQGVAVPDIGTDEAVEVIEIVVAPGDTVAEGDSLIVLESDKASMEVPAPFGGEVISLSVAIGDQVRQGDAIAVVKSAATETESVATPVEAEKPPAGIPAQAPPVITASPAATEVDTPAPVVGGSVYAGPAVRKLAREFGVELSQVDGTGPKGRILKEDVQNFVKSSLGSKSGGPTSGAGIPPIPEIDFSAFGEVDVQPLSRIDKLTAENMHRSWLNVPRVTQFDEADITEMESFRASMKAEAEKKGVKLTPLPFLLKACAAALLDNPKLNSSMGSDGESLVYKNYVHIGMAVDTPAGLVVPVVRDVDKKSLWQLAEETADLALRARDRKLKIQDMQGACFTISSLGGIGGTGFTPIINAPEVAILGVSKLAVKPIWNGSEFEPRKMLPLALAYDHRVVNGADGGRFVTQLCASLADIRRLLL
jgi:pyruvate dehydrogenase E2 component (dihydrolipoamide acetyltransferase)